jgi:membrane protein YqaA with SNARE-associated domain
MEFTSLSDALISLIPIYGQWIIFGIVALESAGVPVPGETIVIAAALLAATAGRINIVVVVLAAAAGASVGDGMRRTRCGSIIATWLCLILCAPAGPHRFSRRKAK